MKLLYSFETSKGIFYIGRSQDGRFHPIFDGESLGSYAHDWQAADDLAGGYTFSVFGISDTSELEIPHDLGEWEHLPKS